MTSHPVFLAVPVCSDRCVHTPCFPSSVRVQTRRFYSINLGVAEKEEDEDQEEVNVKGLSQSTLSHGTQISMNS